MSACHVRDHEPARPPTECEDVPVTASNQWQPIYGDDIGPTTSDRIRSGVSLGVVLVILGTALAAGLALSVVVLFGLFGASIG